jgi:phosphoribosylamine---glycine ligase
VNGRRIWGPNQRAANFEASKAFSQEFMERHGIPTAKAGAFQEASVAKKFAASLSGRCAVKADGLALGKGVLLCHNVNESDRAIDEILVGKFFGAAGGTVVIQELLEGIEISLHALCDAKTARLFPASQDHKRALDGDAGLNTGGMGAYSPVPFLSDAGLAAVGARVLDPWLRGCEAEGIDFHGILYPGVMLTKAGPRVLEFNARFGDPETQALVPRLEGDLLEALAAAAHGDAAAVALRESTDAAVTVVLAGPDYPERSDYTGVAVEGIPEAESAGALVFHGGTAIHDGGVVTNGGRILSVTCLGPTIPDARERAYEAVARVHFEGARFRRDIAAARL